MADKLKEIPGKALEWWNKFTSRQKTIIVAIVAVVVFTFGIIIYTFNRPQYTRLGSYENSTTAAEIVKILDAAGITHRESADARTIDVLTGQLAQANLAIATEGYVPDSLKYSDIVQSGMSTTSADRENQYTIFRQKELENMFARTMPVKDVSVQLTMQSNSGRLGDTKAENYAYIQVTVTEDFNSANATAMAKAAATALGNDSTANITIVDQNFNLLFAGGDDYSAMGIASSIQELRTQAEAMVTNQVKKVLLGTKQFSTVEVSSHLSVDFSNYSKEVTEYYANDGYVNGMIQSQDTYTSETTNGLQGGVPGTDSNGENLTGYEYLGLGGGSSSTEERSTNYQNNVSQTSTITPAGSINYGDSSISVALIKYRDYYEANVERQGLLDGITWEDFKEQNRDDIKREVDTDIVQMVANASGISAEKVVVVSYESSRFFDKEGFMQTISGTDILSIVMIVLILSLLAFVILRSMVSKKKPVEEEPELSVEDMLKSTPEQPEVSDLDVETKSETRKMVEKFVDENPEAAANLLRNWLNEDWN